MKKEDIKLTGNTIENIQIMAPMLNERQQAIVFGRILEWFLHQSDLSQQAETKPDEKRELQEV